MENVFKNLIRVGQVSAVNPAKATARVVFEAHGLVSYDLPVLQHQTLRNKDYWLPDIGEYVVCIFLPTGNADGFILGSIYSKEDMPPLNSPDKRAIFFEDGTYLEYDRASHTLVCDVKGPLNIKTLNDFNIIGDIYSTGDIHIIGNVITEGNVSITGSVTVSGDVDISGDINIGKNVYIGGNANITGDITAEGNINAVGDVIAGEISLKNHVHQVTDVGTVTGRPQ